MHIQYHRLLTYEDLPGTTNKSHLDKPTSCPSWEILHHLYNCNTHVLSRWTRFRTIYLKLLFTEQRSTTPMPLPSCELSRLALHYQWITGWPYKSGLERCPVCGTYENMSLKKTRIRWVRKLLLSILFFFRLQKVSTHFAAYFYRARFLMAMCVGNSHLSPGDVA